MKHITLFALASVFTLILFASCRQVPIHNINDVKITPKSNGSQHSMDEVKQAIITACKNRGWIPVEKSPGVIQATLNLRRTQSIININYDTNKYSIDYVSSQNLGYNGTEIHRNYIKWITILSGEINKELVAQ